MAERLTLRAGSLTPPPTSKPALPARTLTSGCEGCARDGHQERRDQPAFETIAAAARRAEANSAADLMFLQQGLPSGSAD